MSEIEAVGDILQGVYPSEQQLDNTLQRLKRNEDEWQRISMDGQTCAIMSELRKRGDITIHFEPSQWFVMPNE